MRLHLRRLVTVGMLLLCACSSGSSGPTDTEDVAEVIVSPDPANVDVGGTVQLSARAESDDGSVITGRTVSWSSSSDAVSVSSSGLVTGEEPGDAVVTATVDGVQGSATVNVEAPPVATVTVEPSNETILVGESATLTATARAAGDVELPDAEVTWSSREEGIATVNDAGEVTGVAPGEALIDATSEGVTGTATVVVEPRPVESVDVEPSTPSLGVGQSIQLTATPTDSEGGLVEPCQIDWSVEMESVATVSASGEVTGAAEGQTTVTAEADCGVAGTASGTAELTVENPRVLAAGVGRQFACALVEDLGSGASGTGNAWCWGDNEHGQVGDGSFTTRVVPTAVQMNVPLAGLQPGDDPSRRAAELLVLGDEHACALTTEGAAWCWGDNFNGQLGDGTFQDRTRPVQVSGGHEFVSLASGEEFTCGVDTQGGAWCWGQGDEGQLGNGGTSNLTAPSAVSGGHTWSMLRAGEDQVCGITTESETWCWGDNSEGSIGDGTQSVNRLEPTRVAGPTAGDSPFTFSWIGIAEELACGLEEGTGTAWCWGRNDAGQLGIGSTGGVRTRPVMVSGPNNVFRTLFDSGDDNAFSACGIQMSAHPWGGPALCWGENEDGQLGDGTFTDRTVPTPLATDVDFIHINVGEYNGCGITTDWALMCWGGDTRGQIGNGLPLEAKATPQIVNVPAG